MEKTKITKITETIDDLDVKGQTHYCMLFSSAIFLRSWIRFASSRPVWRSGEIN